MSSFRLVGDSAILCIALAISTGGCGGKTDGQEGGGEAGTSAVGGTGAGIGGTGGMAGEGPGGEGPGGEGGVGGSVTAEQQMMLDICARLAAMDCVATLGGKSGCVSLLSKQRDVVAARGCGGQYDELLKCTWTEPSVCHEGEPRGAVCGEWFQFMECLTPGYISCSGVTPIPPLLLFGDSRDQDGLPSCGEACVDYGVLCQRQTDESLSCRCTFGPNTGFSFNQVNCEQGFATAQKLCRGG